MNLGNAIEEQNLLQEFQLMFKAGEWYTDRIARCENSILKLTLDRAQRSENTILDLGFSTSEHRKRFNDTLLLQGAVVEVTILMSQLK